MDKDFEHTQPLPRVSPDMENQETRLLNVRKVRELEPVEIPRRQGQQEAGQKYQPGQPAVPGCEASGYVMPPVNGGGGMPAGNNVESGRQGQEGKKRYGWLMAALLAAGFLAAAFCGAALSGYMSEQQAKKAALESQHAAASQQLQEAAAQQDALNRQREELEAEYQQLLEEQKAARSEADKLKGQKEQQAKVQQDKTAAGKVLDRITGDAAKQKEEELAVAGREAASQQKLEAISQSVQAARDAIGEVDAQLDRLNAVRQQAKSVRDEVDRAYTENKDIIDAVLHYVSVGLGSLLK